MKLLLQRVSEARVTVDHEVIAKIARGLLIFIGIEKVDGRKQAAFLAKKACELRIFEDEASKMNRSLLEVEGELLVVSQFTLAGNCGKGRRPSFDSAALPRDAEALFAYFCEQCAELGTIVQRGRFGAHMQVQLTNDGPVTFLLENTPKQQP